MTTIKSRVTDFTGKTNIGPLTLEFKQGVAEYDGELPEGIHRYLLEQGYGVDGDPQAVATTPEPADPRDIARLEGPKLRDAAVDPRDGDFLAPVNAGQDNPHGPRVVSPGIHNAGHKAVVPGPVGKADDNGRVQPDPEAQDAKESDFAADTLIDQMTVPDASAKAATGVDPNSPPPGNASQERWADFAIARGYDEVAARKMSRDQLRDELTTTD